MMLKACKQKCTFDCTLKWHWKDKGEIYAKKCYYQLYEGFRLGKSGMMINFSSLLIKHFLGWLSQ